MRLALALLLQVAPVSRSYWPAAVAQLASGTFKHADKVLGRNVKGSSDGGFTVSQSLASGSLNMDIVAGVLTVKYGDGTTAFTRTLTRTQLNAITTMAI